MMTSMHSIWGLYCIVIINSSWITAIGLPHIPQGYWISDDQDLVLPWVNDSLPLGVSEYEVYLIVA